MMGESTAVSSAFSPELWMSKEQVCKRLGLGVRSVERLAAAGVLKTHRLKRGDGHTSEATAFDPGSVEAYRRSGLTPMQAISALVASQQQPRLLPAPEAAAAAPEAEPAVDLDAIPRYAYLTLDEAAELIRMPKSFIRKAIKAGRLAYEQTGPGGLRVKRADIEDLPARLHPHRGRDL